ncbi:MAG: hypothetical protein Q7R64_02385 [bacterium]|nr:hypothetical protein [bacterium]
MIREAIPTSPEEEVIGEGNPEKRNIGPLSDYADLGEEFYPAGDASALLEKLKAPRNPDAEVQVSEERETVEAQLKQVDKLIEKEKEKEGPLATIRGELGSPHKAGDTLKKLEEAKEKLEEDQKHIERASEYNHTLEELHGYSDEEREHIAKTGKKRDGTYLKDKHDQKVDSHLAKELAHLYQKGGRRMTWGATRRLGQVADQILKDVKGAIKGIFGLEKKEKPSAS